MLKYVVGLIFVALVWAAALVFRGVAPLFWTAVGVTGAVVLGLAVFDLVRMRAARRASAALESGLGGPAGGVRPDRQAEIAAMQAEFHKALHSLKSSRLGHGGGDALNALPRYVIVGPPGAGKTTALRSSGLPFPHAKGGRVRGVGGTRNCDWWLTNDAVILDTAGRWATQDEDREEWLAFLDLLRQTRPKKPVNGILVAVSVTDLQGEAYRFFPCSSQVSWRRVPGWPWLREGLLQPNWQPRSTPWRPVVGRLSGCRTSTRSWSGRAAPTFAQPWAGCRRPGPTPSSRSSPPVRKRKRPTRRLACWFLIARPQATSYGPSG